ncbi:Flp pilus assembly protein CpaB [Pelagibacterium lacus]|uniref:Flp pilus assembly protein CpaB n=1 Tax=Pelagibacterium lacus TaxID=2282655 RepID=A0A369W852_9HYPH|nr:Flp pilus assembly protein CpaB [Pelagibacterium lacus]RDE10015.1 Flp pilus assembly protein CpaB [Pelagibacterium lacus]
MKPARILLIVVAVVAGGLAAFLATRGNSPAPQAQTAQAEIVQEARERVLVASGAIGLGQRLAAEDVSWQDWPAGAVRAEYITASAVPDAPAQVSGAVARFEFFPGEPIREAKLVNSTQGYLSAVLSPGMRAVSVSVTPDSASGGYIVPNDRVDIVLTRSSADYSETILSNVRVLAIGKRLGESGETGRPADPEDPRSQVFDTTQIATFEVTPGQSELLLQAGTAGRLALVLRSVADFAETAETETGGNDTVQTVRLIRNGQAQVVTTPAVRASGPGTTVSALSLPVATPDGADATPAIEVR